jgi:xanthine dehydrogenase YagS FAD-binding subunit
VFEYFEPASFEELFALWVKCGPEAAILAGGTDLLVNLRQCAVAPRNVINIKSIPDLRFIAEQDGLQIGALTLLHEVDLHPRIRGEFAVVGEAAHRVASLQIRHMGTVGGNICQSRKCLYYNQSHIDLFMRQSLSPCFVKGGSGCHAAGKDSLFHSVVGAKRCWASSCSDLLVALVCCDAAVEIRGPAGSRSVAAADFWPGPEAGKTALGPYELVSAIHIGALPDGARSTYLKDSRDARDFAIASVAARIAGSTGGRCTDVRVVLGGVSPVPFRATMIEDALEGKILELGLIDEAAELALKDARSGGPSTEFKIIKTRSLIREALNSLLTQKERV